MSREIVLGRNMLCRVSDVDLFAQTRCHVKYFMPRESHEHWVALGDRDCWWPQA